MYPRTKCPGLPGLLVLVGILLTGCIAAPVGQSQFVEGTDWSTYRSFAFLEDNLLVVSSPSPVNPALQSVLVEEVQAYLTKRGYRQAARPADADFTIGFAVGGMPSVRTTTFGDNYNQVRVIGEGVDEETVTQESTQAGLLIDFYDPAGNKKWTGWAVQELSMGDQIRLRSTVRDTVAVILKDFPPEA
ncbi:MAG: DUF4136 domain-containing protein [Pseudomonadales bacterium]